jgi:hypothetical protein
MARIAFKAILSDQPTKSKEQNGADSKIKIATGITNIKYQ